MESTRSSREAGGVGALSLEDCSLGVNCCCLMVSELPDLLFRNPLKLKLTFVRPRSTQNPTTSWSVPPSLSYSRRVVSSPFPPSRLPLL